MLLCSIDAYIVIPVIAVVAAQYAFALFCLMKLAYLDVSRKHYILWNLFILIVFFIGGIVFLVYYRKHPELIIERTTRVTDAESGASPDGNKESEQAVKQIIADAEKEDTESSDVAAVDENAEDNKRDDE